MKPAKEATNDETLADIEENAADEPENANTDDVVSPDGALDQDQELKDVEP